jgi:hypothetical protein
MRVPAEIRTLAIGTPLLRRRISPGFCLQSYARDLSDGTPAPEALRLIVDVLGTPDRLPFNLHARAEFELALPAEGNTLERVEGVYIPSYATMSVSYRFGTL